MKTFDHKLKLKVLSQIVELDIIMTCMWGINKKMNKFFK